MDLTLEKQTALNLDYVLSDSINRYTSEIYCKSQKEAVSFLIGSAIFLLSRYQNNSLVQMKVQFSQEVEQLLEFEIDDSQPYQCLTQQIINFLPDPDQSVDQKFVDTAEFAAIAERHLNIRLDINGLAAGLIIGEKPEGLYLSMKMTPVSCSIQIVDENGNNIALQSAAADRFCQQIEYILNQVIQSPEMPLANCHVVSREEAKQTADKYRGRAIDLNDGISLDAELEIQFSMRPEVLAIRDDKMQLSYSDLDKRSNSLARTLIKQGVGKNTIVGIMTTRSVNTVVAISAVIKAGAAYLPIDPDYPAERISYLIEDSGLTWLLVNFTWQSGNFKGCVMDLNNHIHYDQDTSSLKIKRSPDQLAYIIYTSGSTGSPKGTLIRDIGLLNLKSLFTQEFGIGEKDRILQFASSSFDASVWEIFMALFTGASLHVISTEDIASYKRFGEYILRNGITVATLPPSYLTHVPISAVESLSTLITAGSNPNPTTVKALCGKLEYYNAYGPTEATICATIRRIQPDSDYHNVNNIGKPIINTQLYILNQHAQLQPIGAVGEICISSPSLAAGYHNNEWMTNDKFIPNVFAPGEILYKTGDIGRWLEDGSVDYLGRLDHQVKIRGHRVELDEIVYYISQYPGINEVYVTPAGNEQLDTYLCAFYISDHTITGDELAVFLQDKLPNYMIPNRFVKVHAFPLNQTGKIDVTKLAHLGELEDNVPSGNEIEEMVLTIWKKHLKNEKIGIFHNFFDAGGSSLLIYSVLDEINSFYKLNLTVLDFFQHPTVHDLSRKIADGSAERSKFVITPINLPARFFASDSDEHRAELTYRFPQSVMAQLVDVAISMELDSSQFMLAVYLLTCSKISQQRAFRVSMLNEQLKTIQILSIDFENVQHFTEVFQETRSSLERAELFPSDIIHQTAKRLKHNEIFPLFRLNNSFQESIQAMSFFDFAFDFHFDKEEWKISCEYNGDRLSEEGVKTFFYQYLNTIKEVLYEWKNK